MPEPASNPIQPPRRLLVRGVNWLGDTVMTTPALQRLREALPAAHITLLTQEKLAPLWQGCPSLDAVIAFRSGEPPWAVARRLRGGGFDAALLLPNSPRVALEVWLARIPQRIGYAAPWRRWLLTRAVPERRRQRRMHKRSTAEIKRLVHDALPAPAASPSAADRSTQLHQIHEYLHLVAALGANPDPLPPRLTITPTELQRASQAFIRDPGGILLGLNPGAQYGPAKRWPAERFAAVAREVSSRCRGVRWLVLGSPGEQELCAEVARNAGGDVASLAGRTSLRELMALLKLCRVLLTNDTGSMHLAAALGTPVVVPFGSTSPELTGPGLPGARIHRVLTSPVPCSPCFRRVCPIDLRCMTGISPSCVADSVLQLLAAELAPH